jgi:hypothetical protein
MKDDREPERRKELAEIIYRINPFHVSRMGKEGRVIANLAGVFRESTAPEFMLQNLMDDLRQVARREARSRTKDKKLWKDIADFLKNVEKAIPAK